MNPAAILESLKEGIMITGFVLVMMLIIEYLNVQSRGLWSKYLQSNRWFQVVLASVLGIIPGCLGTYTVVTLFSHRVVNFASLVTVMIATSGDEAFIMLALIPGTFLRITLIIFGIAMVTGLLILLIPKIAEFQPFTEEKRFHIHEKELECICLEPGWLRTLFVHLSLIRIGFIGGILMLLTLVATGVIGPENWNWIRITLLFVFAVTLFIVASVPDHFLSDHLWKHIIKKHFLQIFLWSFLTLFVLHLLESQVDVQDWIQGHLKYVLLMALLIGLIPESGPHMVFISLFIAGTIPFSILLVNSIVQDGHGSLPLLAESGRSFIYMKLINLAVGLVVGVIALHFGV